MASISSCYLYESTDTYIYDCAVLHYSVQPKPGFSISGTETCFFLSKNFCCPTSWRDVYIYKVENKPRFSKTI